MSLSLTLPEPEGNLPYQLHNVQVEKEEDRSEQDPEKGEVFRFSSLLHVLNGVACFCNAGIMETEGAVRGLG